ncbi:MAG: hypothetical protein WD004_02745 [Actinomycetota bacterium]
MEAYNGWVLLHIIGVAGFLTAHGASTMLTFRVRKGSDPAKLGALLEFSGSTTAVMGVSLLLLLVGGVVAAFLHQLWGQWWLWSSLVLLILMSAVMTPLAAGYFNQVREAVGVQTYQQKKKGIEPSAPDPERLATLQASNRPMLIAAVGLGGLLLILFLMVYKPGS